MLTTQCVRPSVLLRPFVQWYVQREAVPMSGQVIEPVLPRAGTMLIFQFAPIYDVREYQTDQFRCSSAAAVIGPIVARRVRLILHDQVQSLDVLFQPLGMYRLFAVPVSPLAGAGAEAHGVFGPQITALHERLGNAANFAERVELLDDFLLHRLGRSDPLTPLARAMRSLASGRCTVGAAAHHAGVSERHFERRSLDYVGASPKTLSRISRFQRAIRRHRTGYGSWLAIAHDAGYYDQMHLIRDFHEFGGGTPTEVMKAIADEHLISFCCS